MTQTRTIGATAAITVTALMLIVATVGCSEHIPFCAPGQQSGCITRVTPFRVTLLDSAQRCTTWAAEDDTRCADPLPFSTTPVSFRVKIEALQDDNPEAVDTDYNGWVALDVRPTGKVEQAPRAAQLKGGVADNVEISFGGAYGAVRVIAVQENYEPRIQDPGGAACNNGKDDDGDGFIDFPQDRGCYRLNDDNEIGGTSGSGASEPIYFANPRLADVQRPTSVATGEASPLVGQRATIDRGFLLVTRVGVDGFYMTDFDGVKWDGSKFAIDPLELSYRHIFVFNFSTPPNLQEGDCLTQVDGTVDEFWGYTELNKPTWKKGDDQFCSGLAYKAGLGVCAPIVQGEPQTNYLQRLDDCRIQLEKLANTPVDITTMAVPDPGGGPARSLWNDRFGEAERFEAALVQLSDVKTRVQTFDEIRECDRNGNGLIDFSNREEAQCASDCGELVGCVVFETLKTYNQWTVVFEDSDGIEREVSITSAGAIPNFDPVKAQNQPLSRITGTMRHLSFGDPPWILEPRRPADCPDCKN